VSILDEEALELTADPTHVAELKADDIVPMWRQRLRIFLHNKLAIASVAYLILILIFCYVGPLFYHTNQTNQAIALSAVWNATPSAHHLLGTDSSGFDELGRIMYGGEYSLTLGMLAGLITIIVGTVYGMVSGFVGGVVDTVMMRILDAFLSIPHQPLHDFLPLHHVFDHHHRYHRVVGERPHHSRRRPVDQEARIHSGGDGDGS
jgi:peptide/nickel transport system permease protein